MFSVGKEGIDGGVNNSKITKKVYGGETARDMQPFVMLIN